MDKIKYLAKIFNKRTKNKDYENYIVNTIYTLIGNKELIPVTQQYVKTDTGYAFLDLYFPQINYGIEIDEKHHLNKENKWSDKERALAISSAIKCKEGRISICNKFGKTRKYEDIFKDILKQVNEVKKRIKAIEKNGKKLVWEDNDKLKEKVFKRGFFHINDEVNYQGITEIYNFIGHKVKSLGICYVKLNPNYSLWVPFLAIKLKNGTVITKNGWENTINEDKTEIIEIPKDKTKCDTKDLKSGKWNDKGIKRVVFMQIKDRFGVKRKKFLGVFEAYRIENKGKKQYRYYKRIAKEFNFKDSLSKTNRKKK